MRLTPGMIKYYLIGKGMNAADAEKFSQQQWVQDFSEKVMTGNVPPGLPRLTSENITAWKQAAKQSGVPFTEYAQQKIAPQTIAPVSPTPAMAGGTSAAAQVAANLPRPVAPTPQIAGGAPTPTPVGLPPGTDANAALLEARLPTREPFGPGMTQAQPVAPTDTTLGMAGFAPLTPQGGGGMKPLDISAAGRDRMIRTIYGETAGAKDPREEIAVGEVIRNRLALSPNDTPEYVMRKSQFEPWSHPERVRDMNNMPQATYDRIARDIVDPLLAGTATPITGGATSFLAPAAMKARGYMPAWGRGGEMFGRQRFQTGVAFNGMDLPLSTLQGEQGGDQFATAFANPTMADAGMSVPDFTAANQPTYSPSPTPSSAQPTAYPPPTPAPTLGAPSMMTKPLEPMLSGGNMFGAPSGPAGTVPIGTSTYVPQNMSSINQPPMNMLPNPLPPLGLAGPTTPSPPLPTKSPAPTVPQPTIPGFGMAFDQSFGGPSTGPGGWPLGAMAAQQSAPSPVAPPLPTPSPARQGMFPMADIPLPTANPVRVGDYTLGAPPRPKSLYGYGPKNPTGAGTYDTRGSGPILPNPVTGRAPGSSAIPGNMGIASGTPPGAVFRIPSGTVSPFRLGGMPASFAGVLDRNRLINSSMNYGMNVGFGGGF